MGVGCFFPPYFDKEAQTHIEIILQMKIGMITEDVQVPGEIR